MSYRDIRNFTEMLRALGHPGTVSMESFRKPNFPLVAGLMLWLAKKFEPDADVPLEINTEEDRVAFIRNVAQFMAVKANVKLNTKRLYQADGYSIKEILKITSLLYEALVTNSTEQKDDEDDNELSIRDFDISDKIHDLKQSRQLATEITMTGATLFDLLGKEIDLRGSRQVSVGRQYEVAEVEGGVKKAIEAIKGEIAETKQMINNVSATEASLDAKIERRKVEIDRYEKRLQTLKKVRPAFLEEFNTLEAELNKLFVQYSVRVRCLTQLEKLSLEADRIQKQRQQLASSHKPSTMTIPLDDSTDLIDPEEPVAMPDQQRIVPSRQERPRARTGGRVRQDNPQLPQPPTNKIFGTMDPGITHSTSSLDISSDSDSEDIFLDKDEPELGNSEDDSLGLELSGLDITRRAPSGRLTSSKVQDNSDDDF